MSEVEETPKKNSNGVYIAIILLLVIAVGIMGYLWNTERNAASAYKAERDDRDSTIATMNEMMSGYLGGMTNDLQQDFQSMLDTYDALIKKDASQSDSLNVQKQKIQELVTQLKSNKRFTASEIAKLKRENETLRNIMIGYVKQIDELNTLNVKLTSDLDETTNKLNSTTEERDQYKASSEESAAQVKKGQHLQAYSISSTGLRMKINNTTEPTTKARNCVQVRSSFTIGENTLAPSGGKTVYMQVIDPDGKTLGKSGNTVQTENGNIAYSDKKEVNYQNKAIDVSIFYDFDGAEPVKGTYKVKLYCGDELIGSDSFSLK